MFKRFTRRQSVLQSDLFENFTDYHSHILPQVDDGVQSIEDAIRSLSELEKLGVQRVMLTPHIMELFHQNSCNTIRATFANFKSKYNGKIKLEIAAEYMFDAQFNEHLESGDMLTLWGNFILIETSYMSPPINFSATLHEIKSRGYSIVLAHPERYEYMGKDDYKDLKSDGALFQLNLLSLSGYYGKRTRDRAIYLLDNEMYNIMGSDLHNIDTFQKWIKQIELKPKQIDKLRKIKESQNKIDPTSNKL
ncbi:MAG: CpsB/CapC family capsule biosynthesis tyrosine phosphatase [Rikenellaceae bacterium]